VTSGDISAFFASLNCDELRTMSAMLDRAQTPFINIAPSACAMPERGCNGYVCHVTAGTADVGRVMAELVTFHQWTAVHVLYDHSASMIPIV